MALILGISCYFHDAAAALLRDGELVAAAEEERFSRVKHDYGFPERAIEFCLRAGGVASEELDWVVFFEKPFLKFERLLLTSMQTFPRSYKVFREAMRTWLGDKLWIKDLIRRRLSVPASRILFSEHHLSHAASAFFCSPFDEAAILTVDGVGEWATATMGMGHETEIRLEKEIRFPHSLGLLYSAFTAFLGFEVNEGEYKVMGLAAFGEPKYVDEVHKLIRIADDGSFRLNMEYFSFHCSTERTFSRRFEDLFGPPHEPGAPLDSRTAAGRRCADIAASIQQVTEEVLLGMAGRLHRITGVKRLCLAGGVALNSVANGRILRETPFEEMYVQPAAGDGGGALGAALYVHHAVLGKPRRFVMEHAYWGERHTAGSIAEFLEGEGVPYGRLESDETLVARTVEALERGRVIGWLQDRFEWGPRALGNRSILADPRERRMQDVVNQKIKFREPFRPFAPSVPAENAEEYFDCKGAGRLYPARFMLCVAPVRADRRDRVAATTHVDGTARLQVVHQHVNPRYHRLIRAFGEATGVPVLLNTSFNLRGEPIVNTPAEALSTWQRSEMDVLVMGEFWIEKGQ
jgi:carbamoyltransferase